MGDGTGRRWRSHIGKPTPTPSPAPGSSDSSAGTEPTRDEPERTSEVATRQSESEALAAQARWLMEYHGRRSDSVYQRGTAVLAANGVLLGLIATAVRSASSRFDLTEQITLLSSVWLVLWSAVFSIAAVAPRKTYVASAKA